jgi:heterodisulfide reductase subunit A2
MAHTDKKVLGKVIMVGGGIGGIQCALDLAETGFYVYLVENSPTLGGTMARLDKTFPTNDCSTCIISPKFVQIAGHPNIEILTRSRLLDLEGGPGRFTARIEKQPRYINMEKCIACGQCAEKCPSKIPNEFNEGLGNRKAVFLPFPQAVPLKYALDPEHCLYLTQGKCRICQKVCPAQAIEFDQQTEILTLSAGALVISTGFELALTAEQGLYGYGRYPNVVTSLQYERMLSATGPFGGHLQRPSDGRTPAKVAWIQCVMSRDVSLNRPFCSSVCCLQAAKQAVLTRSHLPETATTIYFMDVRAQGKGFDEYIDRARYELGVSYRRSLISQVSWNPENDNLIIETFDHLKNRNNEEEFDLVVLSSGFQPTKSFTDLASRLGIPSTAYGFLETPFDDPVKTSRPGVFVCGGIETPKDIPETVIQAGAAAAEASILLADARHQETALVKTFPESPLDEVPRVGVLVCHCGSNIAGVVNIPQVLDQIKEMPEVVDISDFLFCCSTETQPRIRELIRKHRLNRVVVAACSPKTHEPLFQNTLRQAGLNPYLFEMTNIRNHCSWVHSQEPEEATRKSIEMIRASVYRAVHLEPLQEKAYPVVNRGLVIGGGLAGMTAALTLADQGFPVTLVEKESRLGGVAHLLTETLEGNSPVRYIGFLQERVRNHPRIEIRLGARLTSHSGQVGAFEGVIENNDGPEPVRYGAVVVATGGQPYKPREYLYGQDERVCTQVELSRRLSEDPSFAEGLKQVVMIQCVGSRNETFPACSRVCCAAAVKNSLRLKEVNPGMEVIVLYRDLRTFGFMELYYLKARKAGVLFFRFIPQESPEVFVQEGRLAVDFTDRSARQDFRVEPDLLVLSAGIRPSEGSREIEGLLKLPRTREGFFLEAHVKLRPMDFANPGIFLAGLAHSPRFIKESVIMAKGAAQQAVKILSRKEWSTCAAVAVVDPSRCAACLVCVRVCPFGAPLINAEQVSEIPPSACRGCGICVGECPAQAISLRHYREEQLQATIDGLLDQTLGDDLSR